MFMGFRHFVSLRESIKVASRLCLVAISSVATDKD
jgi:hypothetical protein